MSSRFFAYECAGHNKHAVQSISLPAPNLILPPSLPPLPLMNQRILRSPIVRAESEQWLVRHWRAPLRSAVVGLPLVGAPQKSGGRSATCRRPSEERWLVRHWWALLRRAVIGPPLAGAPQERALATY